MTIEELMQQMMTTRKIATIPSSYDEKKHSVRATIASEDGVEVFDWEEWAVIREYLRMDGMVVPANGQVPLLDSHNRYSVEAILGSARNFSRDGGTQSCDVIFSGTEEGLNAEQKVREGHLTDLSVGYRSLEKIRVLKGEKQYIDGREYVGPCLVTKKWALKELSLTPIGADENAKVRSLHINDQIRSELIARGMKQDASENEMLEFLKSQITNKGDTNMLVGRSVPLFAPVDNGGGGAAVAPAQPVQVNVVEVQRAERDRVTQINNIVTRFSEQISDIQERANKALASGLSVQEFSSEVLTELSKRSGVVNPSQEVPENSTSLRALGVDAKDLKGFSLVRGINTLAAGKKLDFKEGELHRHIAKVTGRGDAENKFIIPNEIIFNQRALNASEFAKGGALVGTDVMTDEMIELLRNKTYLEELGVRVLSGLVGDVAVPKVAGGATVYWLGEEGEVTLSDQAFGQVALKPKKLMAATAFTKQLLAQTGFGVEAFIRQDILTKMKIEKDRVGINGTGGSQPLGILNATGLSSSVTFGGATTWAKILEFEANIATSNADSGSLGYLTTPAARGKWKGIQKAASLGFIWENGNIVNGYNARATNQMPSNLAMFGNWADALFGEWAGIDITVDPLTLATSSKIKIVIELMLDFAIRHTASFSKSTDSAAQ